MVAKESSAQAVSQIVSSCANSSGLAVAVVDANAVISGGAALASTAGRLVTVPEVLEEVRDAAARRRLALLPTPVETIEQERSNVYFSRPRPLYCCFHLLNRA